MSIRAYVEHLSALGAHRARDLHAEGTISALYVYLGPDNEAAQGNRREWAVFREVEPELPLWGWWVCSPDQEADVAAITWADGRYSPQGWLCNIEKPLEGANLTTLCRGMKALGKPLVASLGGVGNPNVNAWDYRSLDRAGFAVEYQAYPESNEGPPPDVAVRELYLPSRVLVGKEYRARWGLGSYGWGRITGWLTQARTVRYDYYPRPGAQAYLHVEVDETDWPTLELLAEVKRGLFREGWFVGKFLGLAPYSRIRVAILSDGIAAQYGVYRTLEEWTAYAASARVPGLARRPVSVYLAERASDEMLRAVAKGSG